MTKHIKIRQMEINDIDGVLVIEGLSFNVPWSRKSFEEELLKNKAAAYLVAEIDGFIAGYAGIWHIVDEGHITNVAVHPAYRSKGIAGALLKAMMELFESCGVTKFTLEVRVSNKTAVKLYEKLGFKAVGIRPGYYCDNGEDAIIMWRGSDEN